MKIGWGIEFLDMGGSILPSLDLQEGVVKSKQQVPSETSSF